MTEEELINTPGILVMPPTLSQWWCSRRRPPLITYELDNPHTAFYLTRNRIGEGPSDCTRVFDWGDFFRLSPEEERERTATARRTENAASSSPLDPVAGGRWTPPSVVDQPRFGAASQYVVARLDEISERINALEKSIRASVELMCIGRKSNG